MTANTSTNSAANAAADAAARVWMLVPILLLWAGSVGNGFSGSSSGVDRVLGPGLDSGRKNEPATAAVTTAEPWTGQAVLPVSVAVPVVEDVRPAGPQSGLKGPRRERTVRSRELPFAATESRDDSPSTSRHFLQVYRC
ncbi:MAG: hypothetical protein RIE53_07235 [Rhodothermales bacterium]